VHLTCGRHGLKDAARYFGFARSDREYVPGAEIWPPTAPTLTYSPLCSRRRGRSGWTVAAPSAADVRPGETAPARLRADSRDSGSAALWELLLVRAYLHAGHAIAAPTPRLQQATLGPTAELLVAGVVGTSARAILRRLLPSVLVEGGVSAENDALGVMPAVLGQVLRGPSDASTQLLAAAAQPVPGWPGPVFRSTAARDAAGLARRYVDRLLVQLRAQGCVIVETGWRTDFVRDTAGLERRGEQACIAAASDYLPAGVRLAFPEHYAAVYARAPRSTILLGRDGAVTLVGSDFGASRLEPYGEAFMQRIAPMARCEAMRLGSDRPFSRRSTC